MVRFCSGFRDGTLVLAVEEGRDIITRTEKKNLELKKERGRKKRETKLGRGLH
jgi:hypothetical protein